MVSAESSGDCSSYKTSTIQNKLKFKDISIGNHTTHILQFLELDIINMLKKGGVELWIVLRVHQWDESNETELIELELQHRTG